MDQRGEDGPQDDVPLRLLGPADGGEPSGVDLVPAREEARVGPGEPQMQERPGGRPPPPPRVPQGLGAEGVTKVKDALVTRRDFLTRSATAGAGFWIARV